MMETDAIREQRRLKFLAKMEKKDQLNKNMYCGKWNYQFTWKGVLYENTE